MDYGTKYEVNLSRHHGGMCKDGQINLRDSRTALVPIFPDPAIVERGIISRKLHQYQLNRHTFVLSCYISLSTYYKAGRSIYIVQPTVMTFSTQAIHHPLEKCCIAIYCTSADTFFFFFFKCGKL